MISRNKGILADHTEFRTAKCIPLLLFDHEAAEKIYSSAKTPQTTFRIYSDGNIAVVKKYEGKT